MLFGGSNPKRRRRRTNPHRSHRRRTMRRNPKGMTGFMNSTPGKALLIIGGFFGPRILAPFVLAPVGMANSGPTGYIANLVLAGALGWGTRKAFGKNAGTLVWLSGLATVIERVIQDATPLGQYFNLSGVDSGMAALMPSSFLDPPLYTGQGAQRRFPYMLSAPQGAGAAAAASPVSAVAKAGMGGSSYGRSASTYGTR